MKKNLIVLAAIIGTFVVSVNADDIKDYYVDTGLGMSYLQSVTCDTIKTPVDFYKYNFPADTLVRREGHKNTYICIHTGFTAEKTAQVDSILKSDFTTMISNAYDTLNYKNDKDAVSRNLKAMKFLSTGVTTETVAVVETRRAGEYYWNIENNFSKAKSGHIRLEGDPYSSFAVMAADTFQTITMHGAIYYDITVSSGYPYNYADYQNKTANIEVFDMNNKKVYDFSADINASADSTKLEYVCDKSWTTFDNKMPEFTVVYHKENGDTLMQKYYSEPYYAKIYQLMDSCDVLLGEIKDSVKYETVRNDIVSAVNTAKPFLTYTAYQQDLIDNAADNLELAFNNAYEEVEKIQNTATGINDVNSKNNTRKVRKTMENGRIVIQSGNKKYSAAGQSVK